MRDGQIIEIVEPETRLRPLIGRTHQSALDGIVVHGVQLLQAFLLTIDIRGIEAALPDTWRESLRTVGGGWRRHRCVMSADARKPMTDMARARNTDTVGQNADMPQHGMSAPPARSDCLIACCQLPLIFKR